MPRHSLWQQRMRMQKARAQGPGQFRYGINGEPWMVVSWSMRGSWWMIMAYQCSMNGNMRFKMNGEVDCVMWFFYRKTLVLSSWNIGCSDIKMAHHPGLFMSLPKGRWFIHWSARWCLKVAEVWIHRFQQVPPLYNPATNGESKGTDLAWRPGSLPGEPLPGWTIPKMLGESHQKWKADWLAHRT